LRCQISRQFEDQGDYEMARVSMGELWQRVGDRPLLEGLDEKTKGAVLLRTGVSTGWIGSVRQISGAQEIAKNLLAEGIAIFEVLHEDNHVAEAQIDLAYCFWREGAFDEGRVLLREVLDYLPDTEIELRAKALLRRAIIERAANRYSDALRFLTEATPLFNLVENHCLQGSFHNQFAIVLEIVNEADGREDYIDRAFTEYAEAAYHFEKAGHIRFHFIEDIAVDLLRVMPLAMCGSVCRWDAIASGSARIVTTLSPAHVVKGRQESQGCWPV
jgi:tetratricopeptide (TPR) repeat protein